MIASQSAALSARSRTGVAGSESGNFLKEKLGFNPIFKHAPGPGRSRIHRAFTRSALAASADSAADSHPSRRTWAPSVTEIPKYPASDDRQRPGFPLRALLIAQRGSRARRATRRTTGRSVPDLLR